MTEPQQEATSAPAEAEESVEEEVRLEKNPNQGTFTTADLGKDGVTSS